jgi:hypothetical protein
VPVSDSITQRLAAIGDELLEIHDKELALLDRRVVLGAEQNRLLVAQSAGVKSPAAGADMKSTILAVTGQFTVDDLLHLPDIKRFRDASIRTCVSGLRKSGYLRVVANRGKAFVFEVVRTAGVITAVLALTALLTGCK